MSPSSEVIAAASPPTDDATSTWDLATRKTSVFARRPELQRFVELKNKVLRTDDESRDYAAVLADQKRMLTAKEDLLAASERTFDPSRQLQRIYQVSFLDAALSWGDNPGRAKALAVVEDVLRSATVRSDMPIELVKSIAGDRLELVLSLVGNDPARERALHEEAKGTPLEKVFLAGERRAAMANIGSSTTIDP